MSNVTGIAGASGAALYGVTPSTNVLLSPDSLLAFCTIQLRSLDGQITKRLTEQQQARDAQGTLGQLQDLLHHLKQFPGLGATDAQTKARILQYYKDAYDKAPPGQKARIEESFNAFRNTACMNDAKAHTSLATYGRQQLDADAKAASKGNLNHASKEELELRLSEVNGIVDNLNKGAELEMTNLQTLISQRQMAIQLTTNLMSKINDSMMAIVANTGK